MNAFLKLPDDQQFCYLHIPKTAGTTLTYILEFLLGRENVRVIPEVEFKAIQLSDISSSRAVTGHFYYEIVRAFDHPPAVMTFLREPVQRTISACYNDIRYYANEFAKSVLPGPGMATIPDPCEFYPSKLEHFLSDKALSQKITNQQTDMLGWQTESSWNTLAEIISPIKSQGATASLELAKQRLEGLAFFGISERMKDSLNLMAYTLGFHPIHDIPVLNAASNPDQAKDLPPELLRGLRAINHLDLDLYDYAQLLFDLRHHRMLQELRTRWGDANAPLTVEEMLAREYWLEYTRQNRPVYLQLACDFRQPFIQAGWHPAEESGGECWSWSGPGKTSWLDLPIDRSGEMQIRFRVLHWLRSETLDSLSVKVDGVPVRLEIIPGEGPGVTFTGTFGPAEKGGWNTASRISFEVENTAYPPGLSAGSPDARLLGLGYSIIEIFPALH